MAQEGRETFKAYCKLLFNKANVLFDTFLGVSSSWKTCTEELLLKVNSCFIADATYSWGYLYTFLIEIVISNRMIVYLYRIPGPTKGEIFGLINPNKVQWKTPSGEWMNGNWPEIQFASSVTTLLGPYLAPQFPCISTERVRRQKLVQEKWFIYTSTKLGEDLISFTFGHLTIN